MNATGRVGFRIIADSGEPSAVIDQFRGFPSAHVADAMSRFGFMDGGITSRSGIPLCGRALTVAARPGDNLMVHHALEIARPGDVLVVVTGGNTTNAVFGELMCRAAIARGLAGVVIDGALRDVASIASLCFPAFSRSVCIGSCDKDGPGEIGVPVACGGVVVQPGDIVIGDHDGVAVVPIGDAAEVLAAVHQVAEQERTRLAEIQAGQLWLPAVAARLREAGVLGMS